MYSASADFITAIKSNVRHIHWSGSINTDTPITFDDENILSGEIHKKIAGNKLDVGTVYASQISMELVLDSVSRYELYGKNITLSTTIDGASDVIPMGTFRIDEVSQTASNIIIKGYDSMTKFGDVNFAISAHTTIQSPYAWLVEMCTACGVELGTTSGQVSTLPNGNRNTGLADVVTDIKTWRDVLSYLSAYLGSYCFIGRDNKLYLGTYKNVSNDTIPANFRYSSNLSDYRTTFDGIYNVCKEEGIQEYVANTNTDGLVLDLGTNPFLQFTEQQNRLDALAEIIDTWNGVYYVPYDSEMPIMPTYDAGDVLTFVDNQAGQYDVGIITDIVYNVKDEYIHIKCTGDNPRLATAQDRFSKSVAGLSSDYNNGQQVGGKDFWLLQTENTSAITGITTVTQVAEIEFKQTTDVQKIGLMFTCEAVLSATATIDVLITIDDSESYKFETTEEKSLIGKRIISSNCGFRLVGKGTHAAKVYLTVTDTPLKWRDLV